MNTNTRSPKLLGDFGEGLVTYTLIRKGFEVAHVDHVGADLIAQRDSHRIAVSVKTRRYKEGTAEAPGFVFEFGHIEKLRFFSHRFELEPVLVHVACMADARVIHCFMVKVSEISCLKKTKLGYHLNYNGGNLAAVIGLPSIDYSSWSKESIGSKLFNEKPL
jgi:hypothetical protein